MPIKSNLVVPVEPFGDLRQKLNAVAAAKPSVAEVPNWGLSGQELADRMMTELTGEPFRQPVCGYKICMLVYKKPEKTAGGIIDPTAERSVLYASAGLVIGIGPQAYQPADRYPTGPWCKIGDWVVFQRYETTAALMGYKGVTIATIPDDKIDMVIQRPEDVTEIAKRDLL